MYKLKQLSSGSKNSDLVTKYGPSKSTVSSIPNSKAKMLVSATLKGETNKKHLQGVAYKDVGDGVLQWLLDARARNILINGPLLKSQAEKLAFLLDYPVPKPGDRWLCCLRCVMPRFATVSQGTPRPSTRLALTPNLMTISTLHSTALPMAFTTRTRWVSSFKCSLPPCTQ